MSENALFDMQPGTAPGPVESAAQRRTRRQRDAIRRGAHPLALVFGAGAVRMHPDADRDAAPGAGSRLPLRCGSCTWRRLIRAGHDKPYPKCMRTPDDTEPQPLSDSPRATASEATDVRAWWPACTNYMERSTGGASVDS